MKQFAYAAAPIDLTLVSCAKPGPACARSNLLLARLRPSGAFELLSLAAWERALGYDAVELSGQSLRGLMPPGNDETGAVISALLDEAEVTPLDVELRCKNERRKVFRFHRRFDAYDRSTFIFADELSPARPG